MSPRPNHGLISVHLGTFIRHEYDAIDPEVIWDIVENDRLPLEKAVQAAIEKLERKR